MTNVLLITACLISPAQAEAAGASVESSATAGDIAQPPTESRQSQPNEVQNAEDVVSLTASVSAIAENLRQADRGLASRQTGGATLTAQQNAIEQLAQLIEAAESAQSQAGSSGTPTSAAMQQQQRAAGTSTTEESSNSQQDLDPQGGSAGQRADKASSSDERAAVPAGSQNALQFFRANVVRDAWGHLPPRLRDQLLNAGSDKYLPKYDDLVRDYFESLATPHRDERATETQ